MAFIIALGVIIILLCSASIFRLIQPKTSGARKPDYSHPPKKSSPPVKMAQPQASRTSKTVRKVIDDIADDVYEEEEEAIYDAPQEEPEVVPVISVTKTVKVSPPTPIAIPDVISVHLRALPDKPYTGYELLQALLSGGMRFGQGGFFYRHEKKTGTGPILFSLASCTKEGTFDLSTMGGFSCKGLILFMRPKEVQEPVKVFELMLETADQLIHDLDGDVLNDRQQLLTKEDVLALHGRLQRYVHASQLVE